MYEIILAMVGVACWLLVIGYTLFSKPKTRPKKSDNAVFLNAEVTWDGDKPEEVYEALRQSTTRATFKGNHRKK